MRSSAKIFAILVCAFVCAGGAMFARKADVKAGESKTHVSPITNKHAGEKIWILA